MNCIQRILSMPHYTYGQSPPPPVKRDRPNSAPPRPVIGPDGTRYNSLTAAAADCGLSRSQVYAACAGRTRKFTGWKYA